MTVAELQDETENRVRLYRLNVKQYHRMIADGILAEGEPYELLDGQVIRKDRSTAGENPMTVGHAHALSVKKLAKLSRLLERSGCHMQTQQPITLAPSSEPEPDAAIIRGGEDDYRNRHPGAADVLCVVEVADSSLGQDRSWKLRTYANHRIPQYIIVNLADRLLEVYTHPKPGKRRYDHVEKLSPKQSIAFLTAGKPLSVAVRRILP